MKTNHQRFYIFLSVCLIVFGITLIPHAVYAEELTSYEIDLRFQQIEEKYTVGEELSEEDANFVNQYAIRPQSELEIALQATGGSKKVNASRTKYGVTAALTGNVWHNGTGTYQWGATLTGKITSGATPKKMKVSAKVQAFGPTGSNGLSLTYTKTLSTTTKNSRTVQMSKSDSYAGLIVAYYVTSQLDVTTASGSEFTVQSNW